MRGTRPEANGLADDARERFTGAVLPALDQQTGGAWAEGPFHGFTAGWAHAQTALAWWTAAGENYFDDTDWWYDRLASDLFQWQPGSAPRRRFWLGSAPLRRDHWRHAALPSAAFYGRAQDAMLRTVFAGTEHAN